VVVCRWVSCGDLLLDSLWGFVVGLLEGVCCWVA